MAKLAKSPATTSIEPMHAILMAFDFSRDEPDDERPLEVERSATGFLTLLPVQGDMHAALCQFSASESPKDLPTDEFGDVFLFEVDATYLIAIKVEGILSESDRREALQHVASGSAWPLFRTLFAQMTAQATMDVPPLPLKPDLEWDEDDAEMAMEVINLLAGKLPQGK